MRKTNLFLVLAFLMVLVAQPVFSAADANVAITNPPVNSSVYPGQDLSITVSINPAVVEVAQKLLVSIVQNNSTIVQTIIAGPQANNNVRLQIPGNAALGNASIKAYLSTSRAVENFETSMPIRIDRIDADLRITSPAPNAPVNQGQNVPVAVTMNREAAGFAAKLVVKIVQNNSAIAQTVVANPQANNRINLQLPANAAVGNASIEAYIAPSDNLNNHSVAIPIRISGVNANLRITSPAANTVVYPGQSLNVGLAINQEAVGVANRIAVLINQNNRTILQTNINNPGQVNNVRIEVPENIELGQADIQAFVYPTEILENHRALVRLTVSKVDAGLQITRPAANTSVSQGENVSITVAMNREAVGAVNRILVRIYQNNRSVVQEIINNPRSAANTVTLQLPANAAAGNASIQAFAYPNNILTHFSASLPISVGAVDAGLRITGPAANSSIYLEQDVPVTVNMNRDAVGTAHRLLVKIEKNNTVVAQTVVNNPQTVNRVTLHVPGNTVLGPVVIRAVVEPEGMSNSNVSIPIAVEKADAGVQIVRPAANEVISPDQDIDILVNMNAVAVGIASSMDIALMQGGRILARTSVNNPRTATRVTLHVPANAAVGEANIQAVVSPSNSLNNRNALVNVSINKVNANLRITSPNANANLLQGQDVPITVVMNREAQGVAESMRVRIEQNGVAIAQTVINNPQITNRVTLHVPANAAVRNASIQAFVYPSERMIGHSAAIPVNIGSVNANLRITSPAADAVIYPGQSLNVGLTINPEAVGIADRIHVTLTQNGRSIVQTDINNPRQVNNITIEIPADAALGEATVNAFVYPLDNLGNHSALVRLTVSKIDAGLQITRPAANTSVSQGENVSITVAMNRDAVGAVNRILVRIYQNNRSIVQKIINNPRSAASTVTLQLPANAAAGNASIQAFAYPNNILTHFSASLPISVGAVDAGLRITGPAANSSIYLEQDVPVTVTMNRDAVGTAQRLLVKIEKNNNVVAQTVVNNPQTSNRVTLHVPGNTVLGPVVIRAIVEPEGMSNSNVSIPVAVEKANANLQITRPAANAVISPDQDIDVSVTMNAEAVGIVNRMEIALMQGGRILVRTSVDNPRTATRVTLHVPANIAAGEANIQAVVSPSNSLNGRNALVNVSINAVDAGLRITEPVINTALFQGQEVPVVVTMNKDALDTAERILVRIVQNNQTLVQTNINNPRISNRITLTVPANAAGGNAFIQAVAYPTERMRNYNVVIPVRINTVDANLQITSPAGNTVMFPGQDLVVRVTMNADAVGIAERLIVSINQNNRNIAETVVDNPRQTSNVRIQIPANTAVGNALIRAVVEPSARMNRNSVSIPIQVNVVDAAMVISRPAANATVYKGLEADITVAINRAAVDTAERILVRIVQNNNTLVETMVNNPQAVNRVNLVIPVNASLGNAVIQSFVYPAERMSNNRATSNITIAKFNPSLRFVRPPSNTNVRRGHEFNVSVAMDRQAIGISTRLQVRIEQNNRVIVSVNIDNPQVSNDVVLQVPANAAPGNVTLKAELYPAANFEGNTVTRPITIVR
ncbi:MAG: hypothetical protein ABIH00_03430 [Armatimonadota bacterium]